MSDNFVPFRSGCGMCKPSTDYYKQPTQMGGSDSDKFVKDNMGVSYATAFGGKKKSKKAKKSVKRVVKRTVKKVKKSKRQSGGMQPLDDKSAEMGAESTGVVGYEPNTYYPVDKMDGGKKKVKKVKKSKSVKRSPTKKRIVKRTVKRTMKKPKRKMRGGMESSGATVMDSRFYNPDASMADYSELSGNGTMTAYGPIESGDAGVGMLAPYNASTCSTANHSSSMKTGGSKKKKSRSVKKVKRGTKKVKKVKRKSHKGGKKVKKVKKSKKVKKVKKSTKKPKRRMHRGGRSAHIPNISDRGVTDTQNTINKKIDDFKGFMEKLENDYLKSVDYMNNVKIGNQRLIQGGRKSKKSVKKVKKSVKKPKRKVVKRKVVKKSVKKPKRKVVKKSVKKPKRRVVKKSVKKPKRKSTRRVKRMRGGSNGSDFALTLNSRGPANAPDDYWGVDGEKWFRQFNKTGDYIPNSKLPQAATPLLAGNNDSGVVNGYDEMGFSYGTA